MKESATSVTKPMLSTMASSIHFSPQGPMSMPATMYAVTLGSFSRFVNRLSRKADRSITASSRMTRDVWLTCNASAMDIPPFRAGRARFVSGNCRPLPDGLILDRKRDKIKSNFLCVPSIFGIVRFRRRFSCSIPRSTRS